MDLRNVRRAHVCTCVISVLQFGDEGVCIGRLGGCLHLIEGAVFQAVLDVVSQRTVEQLGTLGNQCNLTTHRAQQQATKRVVSNNMLT